MGSSKDSAKAKESKPPPCPASLKPYVAIYHALPNVTLASAVTLSFLRAVFLKILLYWGWPSKSLMTLDSAGSLCSILHSLFLCFGLFICLVSHPKYVPSAKLSAAPVWWQDSASCLLAVCTGYMIFDAIFNIRNSLMLGLELETFELLVLGHHFATTFYMVSARIVGAGHLSAMMLMLCGEISNPFMNGMFVTRFAIKLSCCRGPWMEALHSFLELGYAIVYVYFRIAIGPLVAAQLTYDLLGTPQGRKNVPFLLSFVWCCLVWAVIVGSIPFIKEALGMLGDGLVPKYHKDYDFGERYRHEEL